MVQIVQGYEFSRVYLPEGVAELVVGLPLGTGSDHETILNGVNEFFDRLPHIQVDPLSSDPLDCTTEITPIVCPNTRAMYEKIAPSWVTIGEMAIGLGSLRIPLEFAALSSD